jgi:predicted DNA-binding protein with PD1-like motif
MNVRELALSAEYRVAIEAGDDWREAIEAVAAVEDVAGGWFAGMGTVRDAELWYYDPEAAEHRAVRFDEPLSVTTCTGEIATAGDEPVARPYAVLTRPSGQAVGGYLNAAETITGRLYLRAFETAFDDGRTEP